ERDRHDDECRQCQEQQHRQSHDPEAGAHGEGGEPFEPRLAACRPDCAVCERQRHQPDPMTRSSRRARLKAMTIASVIAIRIVDRAAASDQSRKRVACSVISVAIIIDRGPPMSIGVMKKPSDMMNTSTEPAATPGRLKGKVTWRK